MSEQTLRLFVSSPGDVAGERHRIDLVVERLNAEFAGRVRIETVRWERSYYSAHDTFQRQIPEAGECDVVVAVFRGRLGTPLPPEFQRLPDGEPYPSGTAYEVLSAIEVRKAGKRVPDVYVFRYPDAPSVGLDAPDRADIEAQWTRLKAFFDRWFRTETGQFVAAFQTYVSTDDFAVKVEDCLRQWLAQRGYLAQGPVWDRVLLGSPFPGLAAFDANRGAVFFGRDMAIGQALERLRQASFLLLIGASGSGKSSLLRAGLLPRLVLPGAVPEVDLWRSAVMTPGADPFAALAEALFTEPALGAELRAGTFRTRELLARQLAGDPDVALAPLRDALERAAARRQQEAGFDTPRPVRLALGIDQAERLFTEGTPAAAASFAQLLAGLVRQGLATVVMALRSDTYSLFQGTEVLVALREEGATLDLVPPTAAELEEIVTRPVAACVPKLAFEPLLASRLVADARGGDALPLLQVSLARLYAAEAGRGDGLLRHADYTGMDEAVTQTANEALAAVDMQARAELPALVAGLVADITTDPRTGAPLPVVSALDRHGFENGNPARAALVDAFVAKRLLTAEGDGTRPLVRPVHEALLRIWPEAVAIVAETASLIRVRHTLTPLVRGWSEAEEKASHLDISPALLDGAQGLLARFGDDLPPAMRAFIAEAAAADAARRDRERAEQERRLRDAQAIAAANRRTTRRTMAGLAVAVVLAGLAGWQWHDAGLQRDRAQYSLNVATQTANGLVFDLAQKFRNVVGVPAATIEDILDRARKLQDQLLASGESGPDLQVSHADAVLEAAATLRIQGDTKGALDLARQANAILHGLLGSAIDVRHDYALSFEMIGQNEQALGDWKAALADYQTSLDLRQQTAAAKPDDVAAVRDIGSSYDLIGDLQHARGDDAAAGAAYQASRDIIRRVNQAQPDNPVWQHDLSVAEGKIGLQLVAKQDYAGAKAAYQTALDVATKLSQAHPDDLRYQLDRAGPLAAIGDADVALGDPNGALQAYEQSRALLQPLAKADPGNAEVQRDLALAYGKLGDLQQAQGKPAEALASFQASLAIRRSLASADAGNLVSQQDMLIAYNELAAAQQQRGDLSGAMENRLGARPIAERLAAADPQSAFAQRDLGVVDSAIGVIRLQQGDAKNALPSLLASQQAAERAVSLQPNMVVFQRNLAVGNFWLGRANQMQGNFQAALAYYQAALAVVQAPANKDKDVFAPPQMAGLYDQLGAVQQRLGDLKGALASYGAGLPIKQQIAQAAPANLPAQRELAAAYSQIGKLHADLEDLPAALASDQAAIAILQPFVAAHPDNAVWLHELALVEVAIGRVQQSSDDLPSALVSLRAGNANAARLAAAAPANAGLQAELATSFEALADVLIDQSDLPAALASERSALSIRQVLADKAPGDPKLQRELAGDIRDVCDMLQKQGEHDQAVPLLQQGREIMQHLAQDDPGHGGDKDDLAWFDGQLATASPPPPGEMR